MALDTTCSVRIFGPNVVEQIDSGDERIWSLLAVDVSDLSNRQRSLLPPGPTTVLPDVFLAFDEASIHVGRSSVVISDWQANVVATIAMRQVVCITAMDSARISCDQLNISTPLTDAYDAVARTIDTLEFQLQCPELLIFAEERRVRKFASGPAGSRDDAAPRSQVSCYALRTDDALTMKRLQDAILHHWNNYCAECSSKAALDDSLRNLVLIDGAQATDLSQAQRDERRWEQTETSRLQLQQLRPDPSFVSSRVSARSTEVRPSSLRFRAPVPNPSPIAEQKAGRSMASNPVLVSSSRSRSPPGARPNAVVARVRQSTSGDVVLRCVYCRAYVPIGDRHGHAAVCRPALVPQM